MNGSSGRWWPGPTGAVVLRRPAHRLVEGEAGGAVELAPEDREERVGDEEELADQHDDDPGEQHDLVEGDRGQARKDHLPP